MAIYHTSESKSSPPVFGSTKGRPCRSNRIYWQDSVLRHVCVQFCSMICNISGVGSGNRYFMIFWGGGATTTQSWPTSIEFMHAINDAFPLEPNSTCRFITQFASPLHDLFISRPNSPNGQLSVLKDKHVLNEHVFLWKSQKKCWDGGYLWVMWMRIKLPCNGTNFSSQAIVPQIASQLLTFLLSYFGIVSQW